MAKRLHFLLNRVCFDRWFHWNFIINITSHLYHDFCCLLSLVYSSTCYYTLFTSITECINYIGYFYTSRHIPSLVEDASFFSCPFTCLLGKKLSFNSNRVCFGRWPHWNLIRKSLRTCDVVFLFAVIYASNSSQLYDLQ